jgi:hypothetical protein
MPQYIHATEEVKYMLDLQPILLILRDTGTMENDHKVCLIENAMNEYLMTNIGTLTQEHIKGLGDYATIN